VARTVDDLKNALKQVFADGVNAPDSDTVAEALAQAIHGYIVTAQVDGIQVKVVDQQGQLIGTGTQTAPANVH
jgi:hypothetical protein